MGILLKKIKESLISVLPVTFLVILLNWTPHVHFEDIEMLVFIISSLVLILGIGLFNMGADLAMTPMGEHVGAGLTKSKKVFLLLAVCFLMGLFITIAEPDLSILANQITAIDSSVLILSVGLGVGVFLVLSVIKMIFHRPLSSMLLYFYMVLFAIAALVIINGNADFLAMGFDSGGVTTGPITVPFIMALGVGIASTIGGRDVSENSFGLIAMCSVGPILAILTLGAVIDIDSSYDIPNYVIDSGIVSTIGEVIVHNLGKVGLALGLIVAFFAILQIFCLKLPARKLGQIAIGIAYTYVGLVVFLSAVEVGFMAIGFKLGTELASNPPYVMVIVGFVLGLVTVLAEPAVHVLNKQVESITNGTVSKLSMMIALSIGVGVSIALSMIRIIFGFSILCYLIPGYLISLGLSFFVPGIYTAIAFDSGGVASGPLTSSFILPMAIGACVAFQEVPNVMADALGIVAMVAMTPLITIQLLGFRAIMHKKVHDRMVMKRILSADDEQIIRFM